MHTYTVIYVEHANNHEESNHSSYKGACMSWFGIMLYYKSRNIFIIRRTIINILAIIILLLLSIVVTASCHCSGLYFYMTTMIYIIFI